MAQSTTAVGKTPSSGSAGSIIALSGIHKRFPGVHALSDVHFDVKPGEIHALMGENGAGKSTLIKIMSGAYEADEGTYRIDGEAAAIHSPADALARGVAVIYQELNLAPNITVAENIALGALPLGRFGVVDQAELRRRVSETLRQMELDIDLDLRLGYLSIAQQQLVEIAKSLYKNPRVLVMDEPTSALSAKEIDSLFAVIKKLAASGVGIVYVSHKIEEIFRLADRVSVLRDGKWIGTRAIGELDASSLVAMMVGREMSSLYQRQACHRLDQVVLDVANLNADRVRDINFTVRAGEIVGFFGLMGAGRTELARVVFGADPRESGTVAVDGVALSGCSTREAAEAGLGYISENRKDEGILPTLDVRRNMTIASIRQFSDCFGVSEKKNFQLWLEW